MILNMNKYEILHKHTYILYTTVNCTKNFKVRTVSYRLRRNNNLKNKKISKNIIWKLNDELCINLNNYNAHRQWCFLRPSQNSVWQLVQRETAWSGTHKTLVAFGCIEELVVVQDEGPLVLRSSTASQEQIEAFSTLSNAEHYYIYIFFFY